MLMLKVPPVQMFVLTGWVMMVGSATTCTVTVLEVAVPQSLPEAETKHRY